MSGILGKKIGMTQIFEDGKFVPVTVVEAGPNFVLQKKTEEKDGYVALQLGFDEKKEKNTTKPLMGIFNKAGVKPQRFVRELAVETVEGYELGQEIKVDVLAEVGYVDITGTSKGKGTSGVMKRHGFGGVKVDVEHNLLLIKGAVPGAKNSYLVIKPAVKKVIG